MSRQARSSRQRRLFQSPGFSFEEDGSGLFAQIVFARPMRQVYTYAVPKQLADAIAPGKRVLAPFGRGSHRTTGYCVGLSTDTPQGSNVKAIETVLDEKALVAHSMLDLTRWIADYYYCSWGQVLEGVLPRAVRHRTGTRWTLFVTPVAAGARPPAELTAKQQRAFDALVELGRPAAIQEICQLARCGTDCVRALIGKELVTSERRRVLVRPPKPVPVVWDDPPTLNASQESALEGILDAVRHDRGGVFLLHGVTGSGKTEVYLRAIEQVVARDREAIVLVPEIALTPQTIDRFRQRFDQVAVLHSQMPDSQRHWHWDRIASGQVQVIVGARSAIFAPTRNLGLVVIDEEHEHSYKQDATPRYHAREVALERGRLENVPVVLGSATPSLESWHAAQTGRFRLLSLPERPRGLPLPRVDLVDLRQEFRRGQEVRTLSEPLARALRETLEAGGQVLLLLNRRGFSTTLLCPHCGEVARCRHCEVALTFHKQLDSLVCHQCDAEFPVPANCPRCHQATMRFGGFGTERLEEEVRRRFPEFTCQRMDSDSMRSGAHYERTLRAFGAGKVHILLGTQMIAKGFDFPNVRLVGVISADTARHLPDFRAAERTFQLVAQVAGRTGRGTEPGRVLVQTFQPDDLAIGAACRHDVAGFFASELAARREFDYPPFTALARLVIRAPDVESGRAAGALVAARLQAAVATLGTGARSPATVIGPAPAPLAKVRDQYRFHLQIRVTEGEIRHRLLDMALADLELPPDTELAVDIDPMDML